MDTPPQRFLFHDDIVIITHGPSIKHFNYIYTAGARLPHNNATPTPSACAGAGAGRWLEKVLNVYNG